MAGYPAGYGGPPQPGGCGCGAPPPGAYGQQPPVGIGQQLPGPSGGYGVPAMAPPCMDPQVTQWFQDVDYDRSGQISVNELQEALTNANWTHFNPETCRLMIGMFDRDYSGQINLSEFQQLWAYINQWKSVFDRCDRDRSGSIDANELRNAFNQMGYRVSIDFARLVVFRYDPQARQRLALDNFIQACVLLKSITDMFQRRDTNCQGMITISYEEFLTMALL